MLPFCGAGSQQINLALIFLQHLQLLLLHFKPEFKPPCVFHDVPNWNPESNQWPQPAYPGNFLSTGANTWILFLFKLNSHFSRQDATPANALTCWAVLRVGIPGAGNGIPGAGNGILELGMKFLERGMEFLEQGWNSGAGNGIPGAGIVPSLGIFPWLEDDSSFSIFHLLRAF